MISMKGFEWWKWGHYEFKKYVWVLVELRTVTYDAYTYIPSGHEHKKARKVMSDPNQSYWLAKNGNCSVGDQCTTSDGMFIEICKFKLG